MAAPLGDLLASSDDASADALLGRFLDYTADRGLALYPAQEDAILGVLDDRNVILNTPTGSGKSLVASALLFALTNHFQSLGLESSDARTGSLINIATGAVFYWLLTPFFLESWYWSTWGMVLFALVGIIRPSLSSFLAIQSIHVLGPTLTSALTASAPIFGALFAIFLLGEQLDFKTAIGIAAVIAGVAKKLAKKYAGGETPEAIAQIEKSVADGDTWIFEMAPRGGNT